MEEIYEFMNIEISIIKMTMSRFNLQTEYFKYRQIEKNAMDIVNIKNTH